MNECSVMQCTGGCYKDPLLRRLRDNFIKGADFTCAVDHDGSYTYEQIQQKAGKFATHLNDLGLNNGEVIALSMKKNATYLSSVIGCLINGNPFLPIDPGYPTERKNFMVEDSGAAAVFINETFCNQITTDSKERDIRDINLDLNIKEWPKELLRSVYTIYTSGTTGQPKGAPIGSSQLSHFLTVQGETLEVNNQSTFATVSSISFDMSIWEIFMALYHGATLALLDRHEILDGRRLGQALVDQSVSHLLMTPSMISHLPHRDYPSLRHLITAGEKCSVELARLWSEKTNFYDAYGATEATIYTTISPKDATTQAGLVGKPMVGTEIVILDTDDVEVPQGTIGEVVILGGSVSVGYHNRPELNRDKFITFNGQRAYKTGDLGLLNDNGYLIYHGRADRQVKFNGHRIELEEIEIAANKNKMVEAIRKSFFTNGFYGPFDVYEPEEAKGILKRFRRQSGDMSNAIFKNDCNYDRHFDIDDLAEHVQNKTIIEHVKALLGDHLLCWRTEYFPKFPGSKGTEWHQVEKFQYTTGSPQLQPHDGNPGDIPFELTVWTSFTPATKENGCMKFLPGSHLHKYFDETIEPKTGRNDSYSSIESNTSFFGYNFSEFKIDPDWEPNEEEAVSMEMEPGQAVMFAAKCVHGSHPNTTKNSTRFAISSRYVPPSVMVYPGQKQFTEHGGDFDLEEYGVVHVAGENNFTHNRVRSVTNTGFKFHTPV